MPAAKTSRLHYAWVILLAACVLSIVSRADSASFGVFIDPLVAMFGWKRGDISFAYALAYFAGMPAMALMGWLGDRYGARLLMMVAAALISIGTVMLGSIRELWQFYVIYGLFVGSLGNAAFTVLLPVIVTRWFNRRMGFALGVYWAALGAGPMIFAPLFRWLIETRGWQGTFTLIGGAFAGILLVFSALISGSPQEKGLQPYGADDRASDDPAPASAAAPPGLRSVLGNRPVWLLMGVHHLGCVSHAIILAHVVSMATLRGLSGVEAAGVLSAIAGVSIFSRFACSLLVERIGGRALLTMALFGQANAVLLLFFAYDAWVFYLFAVIFGVCYGGEMVGFPIINRQLFGTAAPLSSIYSFQMLGASTGMGLGGWLGGFLFDLSGAYTAAIVASVVTGYLGLPLALALPRHRRTPIAAAKAAGAAR